MGAKYSYGVWERFAHQASTILRTFENYPKSRSVNNFSKCSDLDTLLTGGVYEQEVGVTIAPIYFSVRLFTTPEIQPVKENALITIYDLPVTNL